MSTPGHAPLHETRSHALLFGVLGSLVVHVALYALISWVGTMPSLDFTLQLPMEAEFGLTEMVAVQAPSAAPELPAAPQAEAPTPPQTPSVETPAAEVKPKPKPRKKPEPKPDAGTPPPTVAEGTAAQPSAGAGDALSGFAPEGTQLSLRINMQRIRESMLVEDVRQLLSAIPDWRLILEGSGIDPIVDLDRLFIASPDLRREKLVIAGQHNGDAERVRAVVANMAAARGATASWVRHGNVEVAPWHDEDSTERLIALVGPQQFVICRPADLPRVLAVADGLAARAQAEGETKTAADALLATDSEAVWSLAVEGARQFVPQRIDAIPTRLQADVFELAERKVIAAELHASYDDEAQADSAKRYWDAVRNRYGSHPLVALMGMSSPLMNARLETETSQLTARSELNLQQARMVLGFVRNALTPPPPPPQLAPLPSNMPPPAGTSPAPAPTPLQTKPASAPPPAAGAPGP